MKKLSHPLTPVERVKGANIRAKGEAPAKKPTRQIMKSPAWHTLNTKGNKK